MKRIAIYKDDDVITIYDVNPEIRYYETIWVKRDYKDLLPHWGVPRVGECGHYAKTSMIDEAYQNGQFMTDEDFFLFNI